MSFKKTEKSTDIFWQEYEEQLGEKILARSRGRYISGWEEFDSKRWTDIWGLIIVSGSGLRFHHFPQTHWADMLSRNRERPKEKIFDIPREKIAKAEIKKETNWLKRIFKSPSPRFTVNYRDNSGEEKRLIMEADLIQGDLAGSLGDAPVQDRAATAAPNNDACSTGAME